MDRLLYKRIQIRSIQRHANHRQNETHTKDVKTHRGESTYLATRLTINIDSVKQGICGDQKSKHGVEEIFDMFFVARD
jgi:hypothetical protein